MENRSSGILMHISSLPGAYGIGDFGKEAYEFVDFLVKSKQKNWQILPLGVTGYGDSPYQCFSAFAGNPYFIDLNEFIEKGYLNEEDIRNYPLEKDSEKIDYGLLYENKMSLLKIAYNNSKKVLKEKLKEFYIKNKDWLREFSLFMAIKFDQDNKSWLDWDREYKIFNSKEVLSFEKDNQDEIYFWIFTQYFFTKQWKKLKDYTNNKGINIIGDLPIYVAEDSSDLWSNPELFNLDEKLYPITVAGVPPDSFSDLGQLWGNPIYDWEAIEKDEYKWWIKRIKHSFHQVDILRIDHFRGFESYWELDYGSKDAVNGKWVKGPGMKLFNKIKAELGDLNIIIEDLGYNTPEVKELVKGVGFPNMKVLQFSFNPNDESDYLPHNLNRNSVVYTGTHDNNTIKSWFDTMSKEEFEYVSKYLKLDCNEGFNWGIIRGAWASTSKLAIAPIQDFLNLGDKGRMNTPGITEDNWTWRIDKKKLREELAKRIRSLTELYWR